MLVLLVELLISSQLSRVRILSMSSSADWSLAHSGESGDGESGEPNWSSWSAADEQALPNNESANRDAIIFLIDTTAEMFELNEHDELPFHTAVKLTASSVKHKIITAPNDSIGVVLFGTTVAADNPNHLPNVHIAVPLAIPSAAIIKGIESLTDTVHNTIGVGTVRDIGIDNALWVCQSMFATAKSDRTNKRILIFTNQDAPFTDITQRTRAIERAKQLSQSAVGIELLPFNRLSHPFNALLFYKDLCYFDSDESIDSLDRRFKDAHDDLRELVFRKSASKRALGSLSIDMGHDIKLPIKLYCMFREAKKESAKYLHSSSNEPLTAQTKWLNKNTAEYVQAHQMKKYYQYANERVYLSDDEVKQMKALGETGMTLMGFKPIERIKYKWNIRSPYFIYPDESAMIGATRAFHALLTALNQLKQCAIVRLIYRKHSIPRFVALIPQLETLNEEGLQADPPGFHCIFLPFADDIREHRIEPTPIAEQNLIDQAKTIIHSLTMKRYDPSAITNPALQKHYAVLQAIALSEEKPENIPEDLQPDQSAFDRQREKFAAFNADAFDSSKFKTDDDDEHAGSKRRGGGGAGGGGGKRAKVEASADDYNAIDFPRLITNNSLKSLSIAELKVYLRHHGRPLSGRKDELIARIIDHYNA